MDKKLILIVDDEESIRMICEMALQEAGFKTVTAENGYEALKIIQEYPLNLALCDIFMPRMNGFQLLRSVRADEFYKHIPFIFLTAATDDGHITEGLQLGVDDYITKPIRIKELLARVQMALVKAEARKLQRTDPMPGYTIQTHQNDSDRVTHPKGSLADRELIDVISFCEANSLTGELIVIFQNHTGRMKYKKGELIEATMDNKKDDEALDQMLQWKEGSFEIVQQLIKFDTTSSIKKISSAEPPVIPPEVKKEIEQAVKVLPPPPAAAASREYDTRPLIKVIHSVTRAVARLLGEAKASNSLRRCQLGLVNSYPTLGFFLVSQKGTVSMIKPMNLSDHDIKGFAEWLNTFVRECTEKDRMFIGFDVKAASLPALDRTELLLLDDAGFWKMV
jgi:DNA-binding response OmpR family regulator